MVRSLALAALVLVPIAPVHAQSIWARARDAAREVIRAGTEAVQKDVQRRSSAAINGFLGSDSTATAAASGAGAFTPGATHVFDLDEILGAPGTTPDDLHVWGGDLAVNDDGVLAMSAPGAFDIVLGEAMPEAFTLEVDLAMGGTPAFLQIAVATETGDPAGASYLIIDGESGLALGSESGGEYIAPEIVGADALAVRLAVNGPDAQLYLGDALVASLTDADFGSDVRLQIVVDNVADTPVQFERIRLATD
ncbi:MAG TPA: hypothetical protein EYQ24_16260 [Bacteroidetes bacterium]|nr:hypothetical protein [Bacteroidota bacterium]HIL58839.1 hypothetical protein [Rhodothermales bacterium]